MYSPKIRIVLIAISLLMAWNFYSTGNIASTVLVLGATGLIVWGYFKNGTVYLAFRQLKKENYQRAEQLIGKIILPLLLLRKSLAVKLINSFNSKFSLLLNTSVLTKTLLLIILKKSL